MMRSRHSTYPNELSFDIYDSFSLHDVTYSHRVKHDEANERANIKKKMLISVVHCHNRKCIDLRSSFTSWFSWFSRRFSHFEWYRLENIFSFSFVCLLACGVFFCVFVQWKFHSWFSRCSPQFHSTLTCCSREICFSSTWKSSKFVGIFPRAILFSFPFNVSNM